MPIVTSAIPEQYKSIIRPVVQDVVAQIVPFMRLPGDDQVIFNGSAEIALLANSLIGPQYRNGESTIRAVGPNQITLTAEESPTAQSLLEVPVLYPENRFLFYDPALAISLRPVYQQTEVTINFSKRFRSRAAGDKWHQSMSILLAQYVQEYVHSFTYSYNIPDDVLAMLYQFWTLREAQAGYGQSFYTWLNAYSVARLTSTTDQKGASPQLTYAESSINAMGWWDFDTPPYPTKENKLGNWSVQFQYKVQFDKVIQLVLQYPIVIHNQPLSAQYIPQYRNPNYRNTVYDKPVQAQRYEQITQDLEPKNYLPREYLAFPAYDDFIPTLTPRHVIQYTMLLGVSPTDLRDVASLKEMGDYELLDETLAYLRLVGPRMFTNTQSIIQIRVFQGDHEIDAAQLTVDSELNIRTLFDLDLRQVYHLTVAIDADLAKLAEQTVDELKDHGCDALDFISSVYPRLVGGPAWPALESCHFTDPQWVTLVEAAQPWYVYTPGGTFIQGAFTIIALKRA